MFGSTSAFWTHVCVLRFCSSFFFFFFTRFGETRLLFMYCSLNSNRKYWLFCSKQCISVLFMDPQISLFSNFFIKNGSHGTIYTFKNYFATAFSVFSFSKISSIQTDVYVWIHVCVLHFCSFFFFHAFWRNAVTVHVLFIEQ